MRTLDRARERGATSLEYAGFVAVAALVVAAVFLGVAGGSMPVARGVTAAICKLFTLGQGSCEVAGTASDRMPVEPCVVSADGRESSVKAGVAITVGVGEGEELVGQRAEEALGVPLVGRHRPRHPAVGALEVGEEPAGGLEDPGALVGVRVQHHGEQLERGEPLLEGPGLAADRRQLHVFAHLGNHGSER